MRKLLFIVCCLWSSVLAAVIPSQGTWNTAVAISSAPASWIRSATDTEGNVVAIWALGDSLQATYCSAGGNWSQASRLAPKVDTWNVAMDLQGNALAVWGVESPKGFTVYAASLPKGSQDWVSLGIVSRQLLGGMDGTFPSVGFDGEGNALVGWVNHNNGYCFQTSRLQAGSQKWTQLADVDGINWMNVPEFAVSESGIAVLSWMDIEEGWCVYAARLAKNGIAWSTPVKMDTVGDFPAMGIDKQGNALVLWDGHTEAQGAYLLATSETWEKLIMPVEANDMYGWFTLAMNGAGEAAIVWQGGNAHKSLLQAATFSFGTGKWSSVKTLYTGTWSVRYPSVAIDSNGNALCNWVLLKDGSSQLYGATCPSGKGWLAPVKLPVTQLDDEYRSTLIAPGGNATVIYLQEDAVKAIQGTNLFQN